MQVQLRWQKTDDKTEVIIVITSVLLKIFELDTTDN